MHIYIYIYAYIHIYIYNTCVYSNTYKGIRFRNDLGALRKDVLPLLAGSVEFFLSYLTPHGPDDSLMTGPTHSPENSYLYKGIYICTY